MLICVICVFCLLVVLVRLTVPVQVTDWEKRITEMNYNVLIRTLNSTHSRTLMPIFHSHHKYHKIVWNSTVRKIFTDQMHLWVHNQRVIARVRKLPVRLGTLPLR